MKQTFTLLVVALAVLLMMPSCDGDKKKELIGKWEYSEIIPQIKTSNKEITIHLESYLKTFAPANYPWCVEFTKEGIVLFDDRKNISYEVLGSKLILIHDSHSDTVRFSVNGDTFILISSYEDQKDKVKSTMGMNEDEKIDKLEVHAYYVRKK